jgi:hypothetical protein
VIEHDIQLLEDLPQEIYNERIVCLSHVKRRNDTKAKLAGGSYFITPNIARELRRARHKQTITMNSDSWIHTMCDKYGKWFENYSVQVKDSKIGVTVEHNKK